MASLVSLSGKVSHVSQTSTTQGTVHRGQGTVSTSHTLSFRVDNRPACYSGTPSLGDGDLVTVAGTDSGGVLNALAIRNRSTGVDYGGATTGQYVMVGLAGLFGVVTVKFGIGLLFLGLAWWVFTKVRRNASALDLVRSAA